MRHKALVMGALAAGVVSAQGELSRAAPSDDAALQLAKDAYIYGYPLVTMEITRRVSTNVAKPEATRAPMGQFANVRAYPTAAFRDVTAPNADTLYSVAWLDLAKEPYVLELPAEGKRFYMMPMLDGWTNVISDPGTRTSGTGPQKYLLTGPSFTGEVPAGLKQIKSPTAMLWILGRTYSTGTKQDEAEVHKLQDQYKLTPLGEFGAGKHYTPPTSTVDASIDMRTAPREQVNQMSGAKFFATLAELLKDNPPAAADAPRLEQLAKLGIVPGQPFDVTKLDPKLVRAIDRAPRLAIADIKQAMDKVTKVNGWSVSKTGKYGTEYLFRAAVAFFGLGANLPEDAIYPTAMVDAHDRPLDGGKNNYVLTFKSKADLPPVKAFWSVTMYDASFFFVKNPLNRYTISARNKLAANPDGTISVYIQKDSPGKDKEANWLPAPDGPFVVMMRLYWPNETPPTILDGSWQPPGIELAPPAQAEAEAPTR